MELLVKNRYQALRIIGEGGFGKTFLAIDTHSQNQYRCVIKQLLNTSTSSQSKNRQLFIAEIHRLQFLNTNPHIPKLIDFCEQDNNYYLIQEFIDGENLKLELNKQGIYSEKKIIKLLKEILPILQFIHNKNIIHRDIKPENIIRKIDNQQLYLVDFGASKLLSQQDPYKTATVIGSPEYVAPEQARGKTVFASDIYSLGVTCLSLLTARSPFDLIDLNNNWIWQEYTREKINKTLCKILNKMVCFSLNQRYTKVEEIIKDLEKIEEKKHISWQTTTALVIVSVLGLFNINNYHNQKEEENLERTKKEDYNKENIIHNQEKLPDQNKSVSDKELEKEALEGLILLTNIQDSYYQKNGEFLEKTPYLPFGQGHIFKIQKLSSHHIAIIALAKNDNLKNFVTMIWGGNPNTKENISKQKNYQPKPTDWGVFATPNLGTQTTKYAIRFNNCETEKPEKKYPHFTHLKLTESLPLSYEELSCPQGYTYSLSMLDLISQKASEVPPAITYDVRGDNLTSELLSFATLK